MSLGRVGETRCLRAFCIVVSPQSPMRAGGAVRTAVPAALRLSRSADRTAAQPEAGRLRPACPREARPGRCFVL